MTFTSYADFFPFYVAAHSRRVTRWIHFTGTALGIASIAAALLLGPWYLVFAAPVIGYAFAWYAHFVIEGNRPASFGYPLYSFRGDWHMIWLMVTGRDARLDALAQSWLAAHARDADPSSVVRFEA